MDINQLSLAINEQTKKTELPKSKILITGGLGFIFSYVAEWFTARGHEVYVYDACRDGSHPELMGDFISRGMAIYKDDIHEIHRVVNYPPVQFDYIIHAAAESDVDKSIYGSNIFYRTNILGTAKVLEWAK